MRNVGGVVLVFAIGCSSASTTGIPGVDGGPDSGVAPDEAGADGGACAAPGDDCRKDANVCCNGATCVFDPKDPAKAVCAATCLKDTQCNSGCCKVLIEGSEAVCAPATYCAGSCVTGGGDCSKASGGPCCANAVCVVDPVTNGTCSARCATNAQCSSGCCAPLSNTGELVCSPVRYCN